MRPMWFRLSFISILLLGPIACGGPKETPPNVVFIMIDQFRADLMDGYGGNPNLSTPHLDRLANEGVLFTNAVAAGPLCMPARGMFQTGLYPTHSGVVANWLEVNPNQRTIAHVFRDAGYSTGFIGKWHLAAGAYKTGGTQLWAEQDSPHVRQEKLRVFRERVAAYRQINPEPEFVPPGAQRWGYDHWEAYNFHTSFNEYYFYRDTPERQTPEGFESDIIFDQAILFIKEEQQAGRPFFLTLMPHPPHPPWNLESQPSGYLEKIPEFLEWSPNVPQGHSLRSDPLTARCYYAMAVHTDDTIGRFLDFLDEAGLSEDTIVVVTSDHGEMLGSHGRGSKLVPYAESVDIPVVLRWKGHIPEGRRIETVHSPIDHLPTLAALAGLPLSSEVDGVDLTPAILEDQVIDRGGVLMGNYTSHFAFFDSQTVWPEWRAVRTRRYTYVEWLNGEKTLFDNLEDPYQLTSRIDDDSYQEVRRELEARLQELLAEAHDEFLPGTAYADWYDEERNLVRTARGPVLP